MASPCPTTTPNGIPHTDGDTPETRRNSRIASACGLAFALSGLVAAVSVLFAGAHEEILVLRRAQRRCEAIPTPGPWVGARPDIRAVVDTGRLTLDDGDVLVLYTDGLTEAMDGRRRQFGLERVEAELLRVADEPAQAIRDALISAVRAWSNVLDDDMTLVVARYHAPAST